MKTVKFNSQVVRREILAGVTTSFATVPETVAFSFVAGVNPLVGLYASFVAGLATAIWGGRPGMITGGAGSLAVVSTALVATQPARHESARKLRRAVQPCPVWGWIELDRSQSVRGVT